MPTTLDTALADARAHEAAARENLRRIHLAADDPAARRAAHATLKAAIFDRLTILRSIRAQRRDT